MQDSELEADDVCPLPEDAAEEEPERAWLILAPAGAKEGDTSVLKKGCRSLRVEMLVTVSIRWPGRYSSTLLFLGPF